MAPELAHRDPELRLRDYLAGLDFYLRQLRDRVFDRLLFVENSAFGTQVFEDRAAAAGLAGRSEFISYDGMSGQPQLPRFQAECLLMLHAVRNAACLRGRPDMRVWKVTGRYIVRNIAAIVRDAPSRLDFTLQCRNRNGGETAEFAVVGLSAEKAEMVLERIVNHKGFAELNEYLVRRMIDDGEFDDIILQPRLAHVPNISGTRGNDGSNFDGLRARTAYVRQVAMSLLFPGRWT